MEVLNVEAAAETDHAVPDVDVIGRAVIIGIGEGAAVECDGDGVAVGEG